ncbi:MAG: alpha/beta hydrolase [Gaiellaceae bacterium]
MHNLEGADVVGSSMGARIVLELARRGATGSTVSLDPGGFWSPHHVRISSASLAVSVRLVRFLRPALRTLMRSAAGRTALLAQFSARPWAVPASAATAELQSLATAKHFDRVLRELVEGPTQARADSTPGTITIGWGRQDRVCFPSQAKLAQERFPQAKLHWFERCGHFPHWDVPAKTVNLILSSTGR